ncbi:MAG: DUF4129 domain-containing protein [Anaerolineales bacterium]|nr:MAG: DUF4129 domain-containing protein [Anaerolineales bacterium]
MAGRPSEIHEIFDSFLHLSWRPWRELSAIAMMLMELSWIVAWFQFLAAPELFLTLGESSLFLGLWIAIAYSLARGMHFLHLHENARRVIMLTVFLVGVLVLLKIFFYADSLIKAGTILVSINDAFKNAEQLLPVEIIVISFAGYLWTRGMSLASVWIDARHAVHRFRLGAVMLLALGICSALRRVEGLTIGIVLYLFSSLLAIGAARAATIELLRGGRARLFDIGWLLSMTVASTGVAVLAWFLGNFAAVEFGDLVVAAFYFLLRVLLILGLLIVSPLVFIVLLLFSLLDNKLQTSPLFQEIQEQVALVLEQVMEILSGIGSLIQGFWESLPPLTFVKPVVLWLFVGLLLMLILRTANLPRRRSVFREGASGTTESISDSGGVGAWFRQMLGSSVGALSERLSMLRRGGRLFGAMRVRVIYASLMRLCEEFGCPRRKVQTPLEFLPSLRGLFPNHFDEIELITEAYNRVRYGELPEVRRDIQRVEEAWRRVREQAKNLRLAQEYLGNET